MFSGGVDSFYTALTNLNDIGRLIFVHGFDVRLNRARLRASISSVLAAAARDMNRPLLELETNIRALGDDYLAWRDYHGAAMAAVGLALSGEVSRVDIAGTWDPKDAIPWGSHPKLDPLFGNRWLTIRHEGHAARPDKIKRLVESDVAMRHLRVCFRNEDGAYNCGRCEKCLRTMIALYLYGALGRCATFPAELDIRRVRNLIPRSEKKAVWLRENLALARRVNGPPEIIDAMETALSRRASWGQRLRLFVVDWRRRWPVIRRAFYAWQDRRVAARERQRR